MLAKRTLAQQRVLVNVPAREKSSIERTEEGDTEMKEVRVEANRAVVEGPDLFCIFHGKRYTPGESWHPYLEPQGVVYCIRCTCTEVEPHSPSGLRAPVKFCQHNGTIYQQGEMFTTHELFPARQSNQCVQCSCSDGQIYCGLVTCQELVCSSTLTVPDSCCPICRDSSFERSVEEEPLQLHRGVRHSHEQCVSDPMSKKSLGATASTIISPSLGFNPRSFKQKGGGGGTTVKILMKEKHKKACVYNGKTYSHGEVWNPVFRTFGAIPCILCSCKDGNQDCQRVICPEEYPCEYPEKVEGKCCKICQGIFHLIQIKKMAKQDFKQEAEHFRLVTRTSEGQWNIFRPQPPDLNMTEGPEREVENL
ncbi:hypothetical protein XELAEV_18016454mg [Xenopus laevis]|uniref:VWFC domain-containing protein n=1 Tax=Xenopus laevis TaxID=8355 RepID=A0A974DL29_XENLA|nr:hypothetical protein XELAEV_18016454mg [Xenopus laevis]